MKKIIILAVAAIAAATLTACGNASPVNEAVNASKAEKIEGMTLAAAAGTYTLDQMTYGRNNEIKAEDYEENVIILGENGEFTLKVTTGGKSEAVSGTYTVADNGAITIEGADIAAADESVICNGSKLTVSGNLGTQISVGMIYTKNSAN